MRAPTIISSSTLRPLRVATKYHSNWGRQMPQLDAKSRDAKEKGSGAFKEDAIVKLALKLLRWARCSQIHENSNSRQPDEHVVLCSHHVGLQTHFWHHVLLSSACVWLSVLPFCFTGLSDLTSGGHYRHSTTVSNCRIRLFYSIQYQNHFHEILLVVVWRKCNNY